MRDHRSLSALLLLVLCTLLAATAAHAAPNAVQSAPATACAAASLPSWDPALLATPQMQAASTTTDLRETLFPSRCPPPCLGCTPAECRTAHCVIQSGCRICC